MEQRSVHRISVLQWMEEGRTPVRSDPINIQGKIIDCTEWQWRTSYIQTEWTARSDRRCESRSWLCQGRSELIVIFLYCFPQPGVNGFYGRISFFRQWIEGEMNNPTFCGGTADAGGQRRTLSRKYNVKILHCLAWFSESYEFIVLKKDDIQFSCHTQVTKQMTMFKLPKLHLQKNILFRCLHLTRLYRYYYFSLV